MQLKICAKHAVGASWRGLNQNTKASESKGHSRGSMWGLQRAGGRASAVRSRRSEPSWSPPEPPRLISCVSEGLQIQMMLHSPARRSPPAVHPSTLSRNGRTQAGGVKMETEPACVLADIIWKTARRVDLRGVTPEVGDSRSSRSHVMTA